MPNLHYCSGTEKYLSPWNLTCENDTVALRIRSGVESESGGLLSAFAVGAAGGVCKQADPPGSARRWIPTCGGFLHAVVNLDIYGPFNYFENLGMGPPLFGSAFNFTSLFSNTFPGSLDTRIPEASKKPENWGYLVKFLWCPFLSCFLFQPAFGGR